MYLQGDIKIKIKKNGTYVNCHKCGNEVWITNNKLKKSITVLCKKCINSGFRTVNPNILDIAMVMGDFYGSIKMGRTT